MRLCSDRLALLGDEAGENVSGRLDQLEFVVNLQYQGLNKRLCLLAPRLPDGLADAYHMTSEGIIPELMAQNTTLESDYSVRQ